MKGPPPPKLLFHRTWTGTYGLVRQRFDRTQKVSTIQETGDVGTILDVEPWEIWLSIS